MEKTPFVTKEQLDEIVKQYPTPFHIYDEKGIRENAKALKEAFAWNKGYKEFFAVKATPNPFLIDTKRIWMRYRLFIHDRIDVVACNGIWRRRDYVFFQ